MKERRRITLSLAVLLGVILILAPFPSWVQAETTDCDLDGLINEDSGITTPIQGGNFPWPRCPNSPSDRAACVDPNSPDLFVVLMKAGTYTGSTTATLLPAGTNWLEFIAHAPSLSYYGVHQLTRKMTQGTVVTPAQTQNAVRIFEDSASPLDSNVVLAITVQGTPNDPDPIFFYTKRVEEFLAIKCAGKTCKYPAENLSCASTDIACLTKLKTIYKKQVIAHETGHKTCLTKNYNSNYGGYHYKTGTKVTMDQSVYYVTDTTVTPNTVTWYIPSSYANNTVTGGPDVPKLK
jgi:hypothetical protein